MEVVRKFLTLPQFSFVEKREAADIIWLGGDQLEFAFLKGNQLCNQFPNEEILVFKHLLSKTIDSYYGRVNWFPEGYDMETQLPELIGSYLTRKEEGKDNVWIVKVTWISTHLQPWNLGRSGDIAITSDINCLIRLRETGPKVATKCKKLLLELIKDIEQPLLFEKRKFDLRYIVLVKSFDPFEVYVYNYFWIRLANEEYSLDHFERYEKHFTV